MLHRDTSLNVHIYACNRYFLTVPYPEHSVVWPHVFAHSGLLGLGLFWALWLNEKGWTARQDGRAWAVPLTWFVALGGQLISCHFGPFCCKVEISMPALSVVLWWNFANVLTNLLLKGLAKLQKLSGFHAQRPHVPRYPGGRADRTGCGNLEGRIAGCLSISPGVLCRGLNTLSWQDKWEKLLWRVSSSHRDILPIAAWLERTKRCTT